MKIKCKKCGHIQEVREKKGMKILECRTCWVYCPDREPEEIVRAKEIEIIKCKKCE